MSPNSMKERNEDELPVEENTNEEEEETATTTASAYSSSASLSSSSSSKTTTKFLLSVNEREEIYQRLINEAPFIPGDYEKPVAVNKVKWYNQKLVQKGQDFVKRNFFSIILAHVGALLYGFAFKRLSTVLLRTGHSHSNIQETIVRYLSTFSHFKTWYESDISNCGDRGYKDLLRVRMLHKHALVKANNSKLPTNIELNPSKEKEQLIEALQDDLDSIETSNSVPLELTTYYPKVPMSQFDMVMTQFGLVSLVYLFPHSLGVASEDITDEAMEGFFHLWALYGRILGIMDKFNIALYPDRELYRKIFLNIGIRSLKETDMAVMTLQKTFIDGLSQFTLFGSIKSYLYHGLCSKEALPTFNGNSLYNLMGWRDKFYYQTLQFLIFIYQKFYTVRIFTNFVARILIKFYFKAYDICPFGGTRLSSYADLDLNFNSNNSFNKNL